MSPPFPVTSYTTSKFVVFGILQPLAILCVALRFWVRRPLALNDWVILIALIASTALVAVIWASTLWAGAGTHAVHIPPEYRNRVFVTFTVAQPLWGVATTAVKVSIIHLYLTMFPSRKFHHVCYCALVVTMCYFISVVVETFVLCSPVEFNWNKNIKGTCRKNARWAYIVAAVMNLLIDMFVVVLPMPIIWSLRMPKGKKIGVIAIFSMGATICLLSVLRVANVSQIDFHDFSYYIYSLEIWSAMEPTLGIINACLPVLRPVLTKMSRSPLLSWTHRSTDVDQESGDGLTRSHHFRSITQRSDKAHFQRIADPVDQLYPLYDIHAGGDDGREERDQKELVSTAPLNQVRITTTITTSSSEVIEEEVPELPKVHIR